jgi:hypothetical protein
MATWAEILSRGRESGLKKSNKASFGRDEGRENQGQITDSP